MPASRLFAATGDAVARIDTRDGECFDTVVMLDGSGAQCIAVDPRDPNRVYVGTFDNGVLRSLDGGGTWANVTANMHDKRVLSIAISPSHVENGHSVVYAGTEPSRLYRSDNEGASWRDFPRLPELPSVTTWSFPPRPWTHHVRWIAPHHHDPALLFVGIELGGVMRSRDGGETWEDRKAGSQWDSHAVATHPIDPARVYEAAGGGVALSRNAGDSWQPADTGADRHYTWGLAVDPADPDLWYVSATHSAREAHSNKGDAQAVLYRRRGDEPWQALDGSLPRPLPWMPYALVAPRHAPRTLIVGFQNGTLALSEDAGDSFRMLDVRLPGLLALAEATA